MDVLALLTFHVHVRIGSDLSLGDLWQLSHNVECESSELLNINAFASAQRVVQVSDQGSPDDLHLQWILSGYTLNSLISDSPASYFKAKLHKYKSILEGVLTWDLGSRGCWLATVLSVGKLCLPGYVLGFLRMLKEKENSYDLSLKESKAKCNDSI